MNLFGAAVLGFLLGSIPFGLVLTQLGGAGDPRRIGSGNIGATNVLRTGRKDLAAATLVLDGFKGTLAVLLGERFSGAEEAGLVAGFAAVLGHMFTPWLGFAGGKGVATGLGTLLGAAWPVGLLACAVWIGAALLTRISSLSALLAFAAAPALAAWLAGRGEVVLALGICGFVWLRHAANIRRLIDGTEPRIGDRR
ncbi:MAG: glycerol-3-phosphate 1-O-acyltransferase PlsY [Acetobacteraceae bacterium]